MSQYSSARTLSGIRLRSWPAGHVAQLKLAVQRLESQINSSLSQSTLQTASRKISDQVPFVLDNEFTVRAGFKQAQAFWEAPPGLNGHPFRQLLFYELQHASSTSFADAETLTTPQRSVTVAGLGTGQFRFFRIRVVNTYGFAGAWSITRVARLARTRIEVNSLADTTGLVGINKRLTKGIGEWQTVLDEEYIPFGGAFSINLHASLACPHHDLNLKRNGVTRETYFGGPGFVQCRYLIGQINNVGDLVYSELGNSRFILSARPGFLDQNDLEAITPTAFGSFVSPFFRQAGSADTVFIRLQVAKLAGSEWRGRKRNRAMQVSDPLFCIRNAQVIEVLEQ